MPDLLDTKPTTVSSEELEAVLTELAELRAKVDSSATYKGTLPEGAFYLDDGLAYHRIGRTTEGGTKYIQTRRLALSLEEARDKRLDFIHPTLGLIWDGYKLARDRGVADIIADNTHTVPVTINSEKGVN